MLTLCVSLSLFADIPAKSLSYAPSLAAAALSAYNLICVAIKSATHQATSRLIATSPTVRLGLEAMKLKAGLVDKRNSSSSNSNSNSNNSTADLMQRIQARGRLPGIRHPMAALCIRKTIRP